MPTYVPKSVAQLREFVAAHRAEIIGGVYDITIEFAWLRELAKEELLLLLKHCKSAKVTIAANLPYSPGNKGIFDFLLSEKDLEIRIALAGNARSPEYILERLAGDFFEDVRMTVARNSGAPLRLLEALAKDNTTNIRLAVALNPNLPTPILNRLARDRAESVRQSIVEHARNLKAGADLLKRLSACDAAEVRVEVAKNPATPQTVINVLAQDADRSVREAVRFRQVRDAKNPLTPQELLAELAAGGDETIRLALLENPRLSDDTLLRLAQDASERVRVAVARSRHAASNRAVLKQLAKDASATVRREVAACREVDDDTLSNLTLDDSLIVREALSSNPREQERRQRDSLCRVCAKPITATSMAILGVCITCRLKGKGGG